MRKKCCNLNVKSLSTFWSVAITLIYFPRSIWCDWWLQICQFYLRLEGILILFGDDKKKLDDSWIWTDVKSMNRKYDQHDFWILSSHRFFSSSSLFTLNLCNDRKKWHGTRNIEKNWEKEFDPFFLYVKSRRDVRWNEKRGSHFEFP